MTTVSRRQVAGSGAATAPGTAYRVSSGVASTRRSPVTSTSPRGRVVGVHHHPADAVRREHVGRRSAASGVADACRRPALAVDDPVADGEVLGGDDRTVDHPHERVGGRVAGAPREVPVGAPRQASPVPGRRSRVDRGRDPVERRGEPNGLHGAPDGTRPVGHQGDRHQDQQQPRRAPPPRRRTGRGPARRRRPLPRTGRRRARTNGASSFCPSRSSPTPGTDVTACRSRSWPGPVVSARATRTLASRGRRPAARGRERTPPAAYADHGTDGDDDDRGNRQRVCRVSGTLRPSQMPPRPRRARAGWPLASEPGANTATPGGVGRAGAAADERRARPRAAGRGRRRAPAARTAGAWTHHR